MSLATHYRRSQNERLQPAIAARRSQFEQLGPRRGATVFLGDSITEAGEWDEWFPNSRASNRGSGGERVRHLTMRLDSAIDAPAAIALLIGTNDLPITTDVREIASEFRGLVGAIRRLAPDSRLVITGVLPRRRAFAGRILDLNAGVERISQRTDAVYVDPWPVLAKPNGEINPEFSHDRLHLNGAGYVAWISQLRPHLPVRVEAPAEERRAETAL